jgi:hypothetical protein
MKQTLYGDDSGATANSMVTTGLEKYHASGSLTLEPEWVSQAVAREEQQEKPLVEL